MKHVVVVIYVNLYGTRGKEGMEHQHNSKQL
jgi:hypothetical protein